MDAANPNQKSVFVITKDTFFLKQISDILIDFPDFKFDLFEDVNVFLDASSNINPYLFLVDGNLGQDSVQEWTQTLKMSFEKAPLIVFHSAKTPLDYESIKKNGADLLIHFSFDREFIIDLLLELIPYEFPENHIPLSALNTIDANDLNTDLEVSFDVFVHLPFNKKTILYRKKGAKLDSEKLKKIESQDQHIYFKKTEMKAFLEYARANSTLNNSDNPIAETDRALKTKKLIFEIMAEFFDQQTTNFQGGKVIFERCREIVNEYDLLKPHTPQEAFAKVVHYTGRERTFYNEAINLAVFSSMFGHILALSPEHIEALALAGLLHNIGLCYVENFDLQRDVSTLPSDQKEIYHSYPEKSVFMIKTKRVPLPLTVSEAIIEHRENLDGTGFPHKLGADKIKFLPRILRIAYEFQTMTALTKSLNKRTASAAMIDLKEKVLASKIPLDLNTVLALAKVVK